MSINHGKKNWIGVLGMGQTVVHVGDDYFLVAYDEPEKWKRVVPKHMIKTIDWDDGLPRLFPQSRVVDVDADETEPSGARGFR